MRLRYRVRSMVICLATVVAVSGHTGAAEPLWTELEPGSWPAGWKVTGEAFAEGPTSGAVEPRSDTTGSVKKDLHFNFADFPQMYRQSPLGGADSAVINSYHPRTLERATGRLVSPPFTVSSPALSFQIAGRPTHGRLAVNLIVDGQVVRQALPRRNRFETCTFDLSGLAGKSARLEFVDQDPYIGSWLAVADIAQEQSSDGDWVVDESQAPILPRRAHRTITCRQRYLCIPARRGMPADSVKLTVGGRVVQEVCLALADDQPEFWQFLDLSLWQGQPAIVEFDGWTRQVEPLANLKQAAAIPGLENVYREAGRPKLHFTPPQGWNNDVNGMTYHDGEWHLFYQYDPSRSGSIGRNMHWGHAVSQDLFSWQPLPIALGVDRERGQNYSGSMIVDVHNHLGLQQGDEPAMVAFYTLRKPYWFDRHDFDVDRSDQCFAYSLDRGRTWTFDPTPAVAGIYATDRDPKVFWFEPQRKWIMAYFVKDGYSFYESRDLRSWSQLSHLRGFNECPDVFQLRVDDNPSEARWVVINGDGEYRVGQFDGRAFLPEHEGKHRVAFGHISATQSFNNAPDRDRRRVQMSWLHIQPPSDVPCAQMLSLPVELTLRTTADGIRMFSNPVREVEQFRRRSHALRPLAATDSGATTPKPVAGPLVEVSCTLKVGGAAQASVSIYGVGLHYVAEEQQLWLTAEERRAAPAQLVDGELRLRLILDTCTADLFINDGAAWNTVAAQPDFAQPALTLLDLGESGGVREIVVHELVAPAMGGDMAGGHD